MMRVIIVDEQDQPVGVKNNFEVDASDIHRVSALWLTDLKTGDCLLTQRKLTMTHDPGKWMSASSGTVEEGESYLENMIKEAEEEIGLTGLELSGGPKQLINGSSHRYFVQWFTASIDKDAVTIKIQEEEVEDFAWVKISELVTDVSSHPEKYVPSMARALLDLGVL